MKRTAFTMVELVFVIVILGILAAVAIPKLSATRDDAKASSLAHQVMTGIQEISAYASSQGITDNSLAKMSNSFALLEANEDAVLTNKKAVIKAGSISNCLTVDINATATEEILQISSGNALNDSICLGVQKVITPADYPIKLRGISVVQ